MPSKLMGETSIGIGGQISKRACYPNRNCITNSQNDAMRTYFGEISRIIPDVMVCAITYTSTNQPDCRDMGPGSIQLNSPVSG